jgi:hypothetical protein
MKAILAITFAIPLIALADGLPLKDGRYPGEVLEFELTREQKGVIDHYRTCQLERSHAMNMYTPYVFKLTGSQAESLRRRVGFAPAYFNIFETVRGFNDAGPHWNLVLRYAEDRIEVPVALVVSNRAARKAVAEQGWRMKNPCFPRLGNS